jgi:hypothetical protein
MLRGLFYFWFLPIAFFWSWYFISLYDLGMGIKFFSPEIHQTVFQLYGSVLGIDPDLIPAMVAKALVVDSAIVFGLVVLRKHRAIARFVAARRPIQLQSGLVAVSEESLSKAP